MLVHKSARWGCRPSGIRPVRTPPPPTLTPPQQRHGVPAKVAGLIRTQRLGHILKDTLMQSDLCGAICLKATPDV